MGVGDTRVSPIPRYNPSREATTYMFDDIPQDTDDNHFGTCLWGTVKLNGTWVGWIMPTTGADDDPCIVTRPCVSPTYCLSELAMKASLADISLRDGTRV